MKEIIIFLTGVLVGAVVLMVWTCLVVGSEADDRRIADFEEWKKKNETNK